jgi:RNA polymerase-binding protein DksA
MAAIHDKYKTRLEKQRADILAELAELKSHQHSTIGYSNHQADDGTAAFDQAADLAIRGNAERLLREVEAALGRIENGTYGACCRCSASIDPARLKAIPYTPYCMECAEYLDYAQRR